jgi:uncharacterized protein
MVNSSREFQIFVKPAGADCNLRCGYCYYLGKKKLYSGQKTWQMTDEMLESYVIQHFEASTEQVISFSWHGGEPLLAGIEFFKKAVELQQKHKPEGFSIINGIQTNGTLLDEKWCKFLSEADFNVGISMDGPGHLHNLYRYRSTGVPVFNQVLKGYRLLQKHGIRPEILCVVSAGNSGYPLDVYDFFRKLKAEYITFIPLVERVNNSGHAVTSRSVLPEAFGNFLCEIFDEWVEKDIGAIKIQIFEEAARTAFNQDHTLCIFKAECGGVPVVEHNGDFYSCDHYVGNDHLLGNIRNIPLAVLLDSPLQKAFGRKKSETLPDFCRECEVLSMCNGECPKNRFINTSGGETGLNYLCQGYKLFFNHCRPFVDAISAAWKNQGH